MTATDIPIADRHAGRARRRSPRAVLAPVLLAGLIGGLVGSGITSLVAPGQPAEQDAAPPAAAVSTASSGSAVVDVAREVSPAVVTIVVGRDRGPGGSGAATGIGSGVIFDASGWILTNR
jgi:putative serine protease PepD